MKIAEKKGVFRARIGDAGDIHTIERAKPAPPQPGQYTIISKGTGKLPTFGTLEALTPEQQNVTQLMINDFGKMLRTKEAERKIGILPVSLRVVVRERCVSAVQGQCNLCVHVQSLIVLVRCNLFTIFLYFLFVGRWATLY